MQVEPQSPATTTCISSHRQPRDFIQTKKLYEGKIAAVVQGYHAASGRPLALKVYNRARLDTMERFQVREKVGWWQPDFGQQDCG